jgi:hypothetical protein
MNRGNLGQTWFMLAAASLVQVSCIAVLLFVERLAERLFSKTLSGADLPHSTEMAMQMHWPVAIVGVCVLGVLGYWRAPAGSKSAYVCFIAMLLLDVAMLLFCLYGYLLPFALT